MKIDIDNIIKAKLTSIDAKAARLEEIQIKVDRVNASDMDFFSKIRALTALTFERQQVLWSAK